MQSLDEEFGEDGLVVLALSNEEPEKVQPYVEKMGIELRVASGSRSSPDYGVRGIPSACLIGPDGKVVWAGHPGSLSKGKVKEALKGAKPMPESFMAFSVKEELDGRLASVGASIEKGELSKALDALRPIAADDSAGEGERAQAASLVKEIEEHVKLLNQQAQTFENRLDLLNALRVYEALEQEFSRDAIGAKAKERIASIQQDEDLARELEAARAYERLRQSVARLATSKQAKKYEDFHEKWKGTRAGDRARAMAFPQK